ncbi:hypothetical protein ABIA39_007087 [Nocardia sp. GAS34]
MLLQCGNFPTDYCRLNLNLSQFREIRHSTDWSPPGGPIPLVRPGGIATWICDNMTADGIPAHHAVALGQVDAETVDPATVLAKLRQRGIPTRDPHGRPRA